MTNKPLKIGFIGGALDSAVGATHKISSQLDGRWKLSCGCFSTESNMNIQTGTTWGLDANRIYPNWKDLVVNEKGNIDAVAVLTPTPTHKEIVHSLIENEYAVISEKALATDSNEALELKQLVKEKNSFLSVTYNYTGYPMVRELRGIIKSGELGEINQIHIEMPQEGFSRLSKDNSKPKPQRWRLEDGSVPTLHLDLAVHIHQMIKFLCGQQPLDLVAHNNNFGFFDNIVDNTICIARYTGNIDCNIWFGKSALGHSNGLRLRIYGSKASAEWFQIEPEMIHINNNLGQALTFDRSATSIEVANKPRYNRFKAGHPAGFIEAFANYYYDLADALIEYKNTGSYSSEWVYGSTTAYEGLVMLEAMTKSAAKKSWVSVEELNN